MPQTPERRMEIYWERVSKGLCTLCGREKLEGIKFCNECNEKRKKYAKKYWSKKDADRTKAWRQKRNDAGLCWRCGKNPKTENTKQCEECNKKSYARINELKNLKRKLGVCLACASPAREGFKYCEFHSQKNRERNRSMRRLVLEHYGNKCACCGEDRYEFLSMDHKNGDGSKHRKEVGMTDRMMTWIIRNNYPDTFQILCHNCNMAKGFYGECPHERERREEYKCIVK